MVFTDAHSSPSLLFVFVFEVYFWSISTLLICRCLSQRSSSSLCFPLSPFACLHLVFQTKLFSSLFCLVPTCWFCFPSPSLQSGDTGGSGPPRCAFDHSCDPQQTCACLGEEGKTCMRQVRIHGEGAEERCCSSSCGPYRNARQSTVRSLSLPSLKWPTMAGNHAPNSETHRWEMRCLWWVTCCECSALLIHIECDLG